MKSTDVQLCINHNLFHPNSTSSRHINIRPFQRVNRPNWNNLNIIPIELTIHELLKSFYLIFPDQIRIVHPSKRTFDGKVEDYILALEKGNLILQCDEISILSKNWINTFLSKRLYCDVVILNNPQHSLNILKFEEKGKLFIVLIDFQNGYAYPYDAKNMSFIDLRSLRRKHLSREDGFFFLSNDYLSKKRIFIQDILPRNFLYPESDKYFSSNNNALFPYYLEAQSFHKKLWFDNHYVSKAKFQKHLFETIFNWTFFQRRKN